jgi:16S rRNA (cytosine1402-N4)-methyltransferase
MSAPPHVPVLLGEVVEALQPAPGKLIVDGTFGAGGYARALLEAGAQVLAFDRDPTTRRFAAPLEAAHAGRLTWVCRRFSEMAEGVAAQGRETCDGVALDLGVSSMQVDEAERGFSFAKDGPLDMRMGADGPTAADLVNEAPEAELARVLWVYGEERASRRIAHVLVRRRAERPFAGTLDLAETVERALGGRRGAPVHPATRTFQALRIAVNEELAELEVGLAAAETVLAPGGRLAVVTFHSLEDRIVKSFLAVRSGRRGGPSRHRPEAAKGPEPSFRLLFNGARAPSPAEVAANPRARSAKLRAAERTAAPAWRQAA